MGETPSVRDRGSAAGANAPRAAEAHQRGAGAIRRMRVAGESLTPSAVADAAGCGRRTDQRLLGTLREECQGGAKVPAAPPASTAPAEAAELNPAGPWLSVRDFAHWLQVPPSAVYAEIRRGRLPAVRIGRHLRIRGADAAALAVRPPGRPGPRGGA